MVKRIRKKWKKKHKGQWNRIKYERKNNKRESHTTEAKTKITQRIMINRMIKENEYLCKGRWETEGKRKEKEENYLNRNDKENEY